MKTLPTVFKTTLVLSLLLTTKVTAQNTGSSNTENTETHTTFNAELKNNIKKALEPVAPKQYSESKIQKRIRKQKDPILIPYSLNKKNFSLC